MENLQHTPHTFVPCSSELQGKIILVTGASQGIGQAITQCYAQYGATIIMLGRSAEKLAEIHDELVATNYPQPTIYPFNLCSATLEDYDALRCTIEDKFGHLDGVVHNAGILGQLSPLEHYPINTWYEVLQVNLNSVFLLHQATAPLLQKAKTASVIMTLSEFAFASKANWGAYAVASAGCRALMETLAHEYQDYRPIRVNGIMPYKIHTQLRTKAYPAENANLLQQPHTITEPYLYLMSSVSEKTSGKWFKTSDTP